MSSLYKDRSAPRLHFFPRRTTFLKYKFTVPTREKHAAYMPSWMEKVQKTRQEIIDNLNSAKKREELCSRRRRCDSRHSTLSQPSPRMLHFLHSTSIDGGTAVHEDLERQYQELRVQMFPPRSREKQPAGKPEQQTEEHIEQIKLKTKKTRFKDVRERDRPRNVSDTASSAPSTGRSHQYRQVPVSELLESDALGSDHFLKHLNCVKQLARRYRRHRRQRHLSRVVDVQDTY